MLYFSSGCIGWLPAPCLKICDTADKLPSIVKSLISDKFFYKIWNSHGDNHSEVVFKVCAQSGRLWPQGKVLVLVLFDPFVSNNALNVTLM